VDTRDTAEQAELRRAARQLARELGPATVPDLDDRARAARLAAAARDAGWFELRDDAGGGVPLATGAEVAIVADALGGCAADLPFAGSVLAADLARRAGSKHVPGTVVAFAPDLVSIAAELTAVASDVRYAIDGGIDGPDSAYVLVPSGDGFRLATVRIDALQSGAMPGADLTRSVRAVAPGVPVVDVSDQRRSLTGDDLARWCALGLAVTSADLVGVMRGVLELTVAYAAERRQYGVPVGSFQAVQHLLAEARCLMEGSLSIALHASWAVDSLEPLDAVAAGRVAKAYCTRAAREVTETAVQVHGGIGNTWECMVHVYLRRALLSSQWFGDDGEQLQELERARLGAADGLL
jgi:alkylation response protein AidB-like acyl-CoA dehydrogenase